MTVSSLISGLQYNGDGATVSFAVSFPFYTLDVVLVASDGSETIWTEGTQYDILSASGNPYGDGTTGTLTVKVAPTDYTPASGQKLRIQRQTVRTQAADFINNDAFDEDTLEEALDKLIMLVQELQHRSNVHFVRNVSGTNTITGKCFPTITAYSQAKHIIVTPDVTNTGATTINLDGLGAISVVEDWAGTACGGGELVVDQPQLLVFDPTNNRYVIAGRGAQGPAYSTGSRRFKLTNSGGVAQAATATTGISLTALTVGDTFLYKPTANITGAGPTLAIDSVAALTIKGPVSQALAADEINTLTWYELMYDGADLVIINGY